MKIYQTGHGICFEWKNSFLEFVIDRRNVAIIPTIIVSYNLAIYSHKNWDICFWWIVFGAHFTHFREKTL